MKQVKRIKVLPRLAHAPTDAPEPFGHTFKVLQGHMDLMAAFPMQPIDQFTWEIVDVTIVAGLHWTYKKCWNPKHRIPHSAKQYESFGDVLYAFLRLCIEVHAIHPLGRQYSNASEWFLGICQELRRDSFLSAQSKHSKLADLKKIRAEITDYRNSKNPSDPEKQPHIWALTEAVIELHRSDNFPKLVRGLWIGSLKVGRFENKGLIASLTALCNQVEEKGMAPFWVQDQSIIVQEGKGRSLIEANNVLISSYLSNSKTFV